MLKLPSRRRGMVVRPVSRRYLSVGESAITGKGFVLLSLPRLHLFMSFAVPNGPDSCDDFKGILL